ncbi:hypothetical protein GCM10023093_07710 [Nemorincola caseinilytica]|uniref:PKD domain-containing protein n=1 Tax=Nemorincola caseinilytica TaxID=2054315 RepID=A0ABP8N689_9BACT
MKKILLFLVLLSCTLLSKATTGLITGAFTVCIGHTVTLSCTPPGGTWASSAPGIASINISTGVVTGLGPGTTTISYTESGNVSTAVMTVYATPAAISGPSTLCQGDTLTIGPMAGGTWSSSPPAVGTVGTVAALFGISAGTVVVTYTTTTGCYTTKIFTVNPTVGDITGTTSVCLGATVTLSIASAGGTWSSNAPSVVYMNMSTGAMTGVGVGTATIRYVPATGCQGTSVVTVNGLPSPITGAASVCAGSSILLSSASTGGTWESSAPAVGTINATGVFTGIAAGTATVKYTLSTGCFTSMVVTVNALPDNIAGSGHVCVGGTTTMNCTTAGGIWTSSVPVVGTISPTGVITGLAAGITNISYMLSATGCYKTMAVAVDALPVSLTGQMVCKNASITLTGIPGGGTWSSSDATTATITITGVLTGQNTGTAIITYTLPTTCRTTTTVTVNAPPTAILGDLAFCDGLVTTLSCTTPGGTWSSSNAGVATINPASGIMVGLSGGTARVSYIMPNGCRAEAVVTVNNLPMSIFGTMQICVGGTSTLSSGPVGTWSSSNTSVATIDAAGTMRGVSAGACVITFATPSNCRRTAYVTVNPLPAAIVGAASAFCPGSTATLSSATIGGTWASDNDAVATVNMFTGVLTAMSPGTTTVSYTVVTGCSASAPVMVSTSAPCSGMPDTATANASATTACVGSTVSLSVEMGGAPCGIDFQWQQNTGAGWTNITGATNWTYSAPVSAAVQYRNVVSCGTSGLSRISSEVAITATAGIDVHSVVPTTDTSCYATRFHVSSCAYGPLMAVHTYFGDGTDAVQALGGTTSGTAQVYHVYSSPGSYTVKHVLLNGGVPSDSVSFSYEHYFCRTIPVKFYSDNNTNCNFDGGEAYNMLPVLTAIDSAGVPIDTVVSTSGFFYQVYGAPGTVYGFRPMVVHSGFVISCLPGGVLYDTVTTDATFSTNYIATNCSGTPGVDVAVAGTMRCGRHTARYDMVINNYHCDATSPTVTFTFSHKYDYQYATITPTTVAGNTITWNLPPHTVSTGPTYMTVYLERYEPPTNWLMPGDTIASTVTVTAGSGETDLANNTVSRIDTVKSSYDPNDIMVTPAGNILPCAQLQYRVRFENMGNAAAENVHVLDTLSEYLDPASIAPVIASHAMNISVMNDGGYTIARFDFPDIQLADSSQHDDNKGMVIFNINARNGVPDGTHIRHRVGIYFDDNPVVMTNEVENIVGMPAITGDDTVCAGDRILLSNALQGGVWAAGNASATVAGGLVSGIARGLDTISYTATNSCVTRTATKKVFVEELPVVPGITGMNILCPAWVVVLNNATPSGIWSSGNVAVATVDAGGLLTGVSAGTAMISYAVTNYCGTTASSDTFTIQPMVTPSVTVTSDAPGILCAGTAVLFTATPVYGGVDPTYTWYVNGEIIQGELADTLLYTPVQGDVITSRLSSTELCVTDNYAHDDIAMHVTSNVLPAVSTTTAPMGTLCQGSMAAFIAKPTNGGTAPAIWWLRNGAFAGSGLTYNYVPTHGDVVVCKLASTLPCIFADTVSSAGVTMSVDAAYLPVVGLNAKPGLTVEAGKTATLTATVTGGGSTPKYQWIVNNIPVNGATNATFVTDELRDEDSVSCHVRGSGVCAYYSFNSVRMRVLPATLAVGAAGGALAMSVVPNPSNGQFAITGNVQGATTAGIVVRDLVGREVYSRHMDVRNGVVDDRIQLPTGLANGVYMLELQTDAGNAVYRIVVDR